MSFHVCTHFMFVLFTRMRFVQQCMPKLRTHSEVSNRRPFSMISRNIPNYNRFIFLFQSANVFINSLLYLMSDMCSWLGLRSCQGAPIKCWPIRICWKEKILEKKILFGFHHSDGLNLYYIHVNISNYCTTQFMVRQNQYSIDGIWFRHTIQCSGLGRGTFLEMQC